MELRIVVFIATRKVMRRILSNKVPSISGIIFKKIAIVLFVIFLCPSIIKAENDGANVAVLMGDSITESWYRNDPDFFTSNKFLGKGVSGQTTSQMLCRFRQDVVAHSPEFVVILAGTNDIALNGGPISLEDIFANIASMCDIAKANNIKPVLCSVLPCIQYKWRPEVTDAADKVVALNVMLKEHAEKSGFIYVDYHTPMKNEMNGLPESLSHDGCHPTLEGYRIMENILSDALKLN